MSKKTADSATSKSAADQQGDIEVSVVMPCLNEAETLEICIQKAAGCLKKNNVRSEIVIADNGSTDGSQDIATRNGARVVPVERKGYGAALQGGFDAAYGKFMLMGDADDSYDFENLMPFIEGLRNGHDVVMGNRFKGGVAPGAMPALHRYIGNPILTTVLNVFFRSGIGDAHCGLRGITKEAYQRLNLQTTGMEFASEMVVKASTRKLNMTEVATTLRPDGRSRAPHLRSFRDGWRHLRFMMLLAPNWALMIPGVAMATLGTLLLLILWAGPVKLGGAELDVHTMLVASSLIIVGYQAFLTGVAARIYALTEEIGPPSSMLQNLFGSINLERGLIGGALLGVLGLCFIGSVFLGWAKDSYGPLDVTQTMRPMVVGVTLLAVGGQTMLMSFFYSMLGIEKTR